MDVNHPSVQPADTVTYCAQARELALRIDCILEEAARTTTQLRSLRLAQALTATLLDELERMQHPRAA